MLALEPTPPPSPDLAAVPGGTGVTRLYEGKVLEAFVGSASKPPTEEAAAAFERATGAKLELHIGGSGKMLSEMKLAERGDLYFPGSSDYMEIAKREGLVDPSTEKQVVYLIPAINVQRGNPKGIKSLEDLAQPGLRVGIARPDTVCVGLYGVEVLEQEGLADRVRPNIATHAESCEKTAQLVALKTVDAVLGWEVFEHWDPDNIETVYLPKEKVTRIGYIPVAVSKFSKHPDVARAFIDYLIGPDGQAIYKKWHYLTSVEDARQHALPTTPVGGEWTLPARWQE
ncbi:MAG: molybdate ABC transporter substrate-binding protein [Kofleriaceae bacterium]